VGSIECKLTPLDELYLQRAYELAARGIGNTAPNPPVGAVVVREGRIVGEGYHHRAGAPHAEPNALAQAGANARGATVYVSLEPCGHVGRTQPCSKALLDAGVGRIVVGTADPTGHGGAAELRERGAAVSVADDAVARDLIEIFARSVSGKRPYVALKMATSLDGFVAERPGTSQRIGSAEEERFVRGLRTAYDAVMVGAGTIRIDDPQLTVRPAHFRIRPYVRIVACEREPVSADSRVFAAQPGYAATVVLVPTGQSDRYDALRETADVLEIGSRDSMRLDLVEALQVLRERDIFSVLCEGGPQLGASLLAAGQVDRVYWAFAPRFMKTENAVPVLSGANLSDVRLRFDRIERAGSDVILSGIPAPCHPEPVEG
jgi:diaminohydroxyphosphoribosylaminopyrimidine deaminase/5-amino-6-(5-phosphoribosylamino)uracil reductase